MTAPKLLTQLPTLDGFDGTELLYMVQSAVHGSISFDRLRAYLNELPDRLAADVGQTDADLNTIVESGWYRVGTANANAPDSNWQQSPMLVGRGLATITQLIFHWETNTVWVRSGHPPEVGGAGGWQPWASVYHTGNDGNLAKLDLQQWWSARQVFHDRYPLAARWDDDGNTLGPFVQLQRGSNSPIAYDGLGVLEFSGQNDAGQPVPYSSIAAHIIDPTNGSEDGRVSLYTLQAGVWGRRAYLQNGLVIGDPTGGDQGSGSLNAASLYLNGTALGTLSTRDTISNADWSGADLAVANGGTGASNAAAARTNLGLGSAATENVGTSGDAIPKLDAINQWTGAQSFSGSFPVNLTWADAGTAAGPGLTLFRDSSSPAANDTLGYIRFSGRDAAGIETVYGYVGAVLNDPTNLNEDGSVYVAARRNGGYVNIAWFGDGACMNGAAGGYKGAGTFNATELYRNGVALGALSTRNTVDNADWSGVDLSIANGGTGASNAAGARANLGLGSLATLNEATTGFIASQGVATDNLATGAVSEQKIASSAVTEPKIANGAVTFGKLPARVGSSFGLLGYRGGAGVGTSVVTHDAAAVRSGLGLGSAAVENVGTSGGKVGKLNGDNTYSGKSTFTGFVQVDSQVEWGTFSQNGNSNGRDIVATENAAKMRSSASAGGGRSHYSLHNPNGEVGNIKTNGNDCTFNSVSDARAKQNFRHTLAPGDVVPEIAVVLGKFNWRSDGSEDFGAYAQTLQPIFPKAVSPGETEAEMWGVDWSRTVPNVIAYVVAQAREKDSRIDTLEAQVETLQNTVDQLSTQVAALAA